MSRKVLEMPQKKMLLADRAVLSPASEGKVPGKTPCSLIIKEVDRGSKIKDE